MKTEPSIQTAKRPYHQGARAAAAEQTAERILQAMFARMSTSWYDEITLEAVAKDAGVTVQTVIRRFGGKEGLLDATWRYGAKFFALRDQVPPGDVRGAVRVILNEYEQGGDAVFRSLAQEQRFPALKQAADSGRAGHRAWILRHFADDLHGLDEEERRRRVDGLFTALDLYIWQIVRRDMGRPLAEVEQIMLRLIAGVLGRPINSHD
jgi:AcrR family transcriptional regulator